VLGLPRTVKYVTYGIDVDAQRVVVVGFERFTVLGSRGVHPG
jgi:hypothetical protein